MIEIKPQDIIIMHMQPENLGGWSVGVSKGITLYHKPSDTTISIDRYRSQHRNKSACLEVLQDLLTPFKDGDIIVTEYGIEEITEICDTPELYCFHTYEEDTLFSHFENIGHTEEGYKYKARKVIARESKYAQDQYDRRMNILNKKLDKIDKL